MRNPLIVGGASGIGLALAHLLAAQEDTEIVWIVDRNLPSAEQDHPKFRVQHFVILGDVEIVVGKGACEYLLC